MTRVICDRVWKKFQRGEHHDSLRDWIPALWRRGMRSENGSPKHDEFWALRDLSFSVADGQALGIIGGNGAGKSTTLKILTGILRPTLGSRQVVGRVGALIEVAAGFHPDLTGRENIFLQGLIMGMSRRDVRRNFDAIVDFSGLSDFIDTPVKRYSSGMNARLGFAIAAHLDPDVLFIDEVLAVGDARFQDRCLNRIDDLKKSGVCLVFVSHNLGAVQRLCDQAVLLHEGTVAYVGNPRQACEIYLGSSTPDARASSSAPLQTGRRWGDQSVEITGIEVLGSDGKPASVILSGAPIRLIIDVLGKSRVNHVGIGLMLLDESKSVLFGENTSVQCPDLTVGEGDRFRFSLDLLSVALPEGHYYLSVAASSPVTGAVYDWHDCCRTIQVQIVPHRARIGTINLSTRWNVESLCDVLPGSPA